MITINKKEDCCGCGACVQVCPVECISMQEDNEGFLYPIVDKDLCIDCGKCERVCPVLDISNEGTPLKVYAAKNKNEGIRKGSSSGGIFSLVAEKVIEKGGIVFGAKFDENWKVIHDYTDKIEKLSGFRSSKYVQSKIGNSFSIAKAFLQQNKEVLFSGTPCQIHGLKLFLGKEYKNLLTIETVCFGVPSPKVWGQYLKEIIESKLKIKPTEDLNKYIRAINFRAKNSKWKSYRFSLSFHNKKVHISEPPTKNIFMKGFLKALFLRPSCHACPSKNFKSKSDITLGDYWGIEDIKPDFYDRKGISLVMVNTLKGNEMVNSLMNIKTIETSYQEALKNNKRIEKSISPNPLKNQFFFLSKDGVISAITKTTHIPLPKKIMIKKNLYFAAIQRRIIRLSKTLKPK